MKHFDKSDKSGQIDEQGCDVDDMGHLEVNNCTELPTKLTCSVEINGKPFQMQVEQPWQ